MDFILYCLLSSCLLLPTKRGCALATIWFTGFVLILAFVSLGWDIVTYAFTSSLSLINQTPGGVTFLATVLLVVLIRELGKNNRRKAQIVLQVVGESAFVAVGLWFLVFMFEVFIAVPRDVWVQARKNAVPSEFRHPDLVPPSFAYLNSTRHGDLQRGTNMRILRVGKCVEQYKSVPDMKVAQWTIDEADKIIEIGSSDLNKYRRLSPYSGIL